VTVYEGSLLVVVPVFAYGIFRPTIASISSAIKTSALKQTNMTGPR